MNFPEIADIALPAEGVFPNRVFVSIRKTYPMQAYKVLADGHHARPLGHGADDVHQKGQVAAVTLRQCRPSC
jgi:hypothetical protein